MRSLTTSLLAIFATGHSTSTRSSSEAMMKMQHSCEEQLDSCFLFYQNDVKKRRIKFSSRTELNDILDIAILTSKLHRGL